MMAIILYNLESRDKEDKTHAEAIPLPEFFLFPMPTVTASDSAYWGLLFLPSFTLLLRKHRPEICMALVSRRLEFMQNNHLQALFLPWLFCSKVT